MGLRVIAPAFVNIRPHAVVVTPVSKGVAVVTYGSLAGAGISVEEDETHGCKRTVCSLARLGTCCNHSDFTGLVPPTEAKVALSSWSLAYIEPLVEAFNARNLGVEAEAVQLSPDQEHLRGAGPLLRQRPDGQRRVSGVSRHA